LQRFIFKGKLKHKYLNIRNLLSALLVLITLQVQVHVQAATQEVIKNSNLKICFQRNLEELNKLYFFIETNTYPGRFRFNKVIHFQTEFEKLDLPVFPEHNEKAVVWYYFLESLDLDDKQNLLRYFTFYEAEIENELRANGLPVELKFLAPALSAMNPLADFRDGKAGIWQLQHFQAVLNGAHINRFTDERMNPLLATRFTARLLKLNFGNFYTPELAVAALLAGNTRVKNAMHMAGQGAGFSEVLQFLPNSVSQQIAAFQAMSVFLSANRFIPETEPFAKKIQPDTVRIFKQLHFKQISAVLRIPETQLQNLNPQFRFSILPENKEGIKLALPSKKWDDFVLWQDSVYNACDSSLFEIITVNIEYPPAPNRQYLREPIKDLEIEGKTKIKYRIKSGDVLGLIAEKYDVRVADLKYWNNIYNERKIRAGDFLDIFVDDEKAVHFLDKEKEEKEKEHAAKVVENIQKGSTLKVLEELEHSAHKIEHVVKSGESPFLIAKQYKGVNPEDILEWNQIDDARKIQIGQKLIIYLK